MTNGITLLDALTQALGADAILHTEADTAGYTAFVRHSVGRDLDTHPESAFELLERFRATAV